MDYTNWAWGRSLMVTYYCLHGVSLEADRLKGGLYRVDGTTMDYTNWAWGQPDGNILLPDGVSLETYLGAESKFHWVDGTTLDYTNWTWGQADGNILLPDGVSLKAY